MTSTPWHKPRLVNTSSCVHTHTHTHTHTYTYTHTHVQGIADETTGQEEYAVTQHGQPQAVPNIRDPNYGHLHQVKAGVNNQAEILYTLHVKSRYTNAIMQPEVPKELIMQIVVACIHIEFLPLFRMIQNSRMMWLNMERSLSCNRLLLNSWSK